MFKKIRQLIQYAFILLLIFFFLPKTSQALSVTSGDCSFTFYDSSDLKTEITPNTNMGDLTVKVESKTLRAAKYRGRLFYKKNQPPVSSLGDHINFTPGTPVFFTFKKPSDGWQYGSGIYNFRFIEQGQTDYNPICKVDIPILQLSSQACTLDIKNKSSLTPGVSPILVVNGIKNDGTCYDILVDNNIQPSAFCADGKSEQLLDTFSARSQPYNVSLQTQCRYLSDWLGCIHQLMCNPTTFSVNQIGGSPPGSTQAKCSISPNPAITNHPISTLDNIFIQANNLTPTTDYNIWGRKKSDTNIYPLGSVKTDAYGNLNFQLFKPTSTTPTQADTYEVRIYNKDNQEPSICSIFYDVNDASKVPLTPGGTAATPCTGEGCTKAGGDPCGDANNPAFKTAIGCVHTSPAEFARDFLTFVIGIGGGLAFLMMLLGAFQMLTSAGNPETLNAGRERLTSAVIGLLFVIFAVLLLQIIGVDILKLPDFGR